MLMQIKRFGNGADLIFSGSSHLWIDLHIYQRIYDTNLLRTSREPFLLFYFIELSLFCLLFDQSFIFETLPCIEIIAGLQKKDLFQTAASNNKTTQYILSRKPKELRLAYKASDSNYNGIIL